MPLVTIKHAANMYDVSASTIHRLIKQKKLVCTIKCLKHKDAVPRKLVNTADVWKLLRHTEKEVIPETVPGRNHFDSLPSNALREIEKRLDKRKLERELRDWDYDF